jgi:hypothetical protein
MQRITSVALLTAAQNPEARDSPKPGADTQSKKTRIRLSGGKHLNRFVSEKDSPNPGSKAIR